MNDNHHNSSNKNFFQELSVEFLIHELKDPIAVIETGARTLIEKQEKFGSLSPRQEKTMNRIIRNARKAREMIYSLLEVGRSEAGSFACNRFKPVETTFDVLANCLEVRDPSITDKIRQNQDMIQTLTYLDSYGISLSTPPDLLQMDMHQDQVKYRQIIGNLVKNALHFRRERIDIKMDKIQDFLIVTVTDDGPGVEPEYCESIFQRYSQANDCTITQRQGHGLGLAGARIMARCLGGDIELTCNKTDGTIFQLTLPIDFTTS
jgi:two-component system OmpR family sensor kinase